MQYKIFFFLALAYIAQANLEFEQKEDFSYKAILGNMEFYLRRGFSDIKDCYTKTKQDYERVIKDFESKLLQFSKQQPGPDEKKVVGRVYKIAKELMMYNGNLTNFFKSETSENFPEIAAYVDKTRVEVEKDINQHKENILNPNPWNTQKFEKLERSFKPKRDEFVVEVEKVVAQLASCMDAPKCS